MSVAARRWTVRAVLMLLVAATGSFFGLWWFCERSAGATDLTRGEAKQAPRYAVLNGRWQRPDGGYLLEIRDAAEGGTIHAAYFNPKPIRVAKAQAAQEDGKLKVVVELRDVNYPGSIYNLTYDPADDRLKGTYYQAVAQETYRVFFLRVKP